MREVVGEEKMVPKLAGRTQCDLEKAGQVGVGAPAAALGDVGRNGGTGPAYLALQAVLFFPGKRRGGFVGGQSKPVAPLPDPELREIAHTQDYRLLVPLPVA